MKTFWYAICLLTTLWGCYQTNTPAKIRKQHAEKFSLQTSDIESLKNSSSDHFFTKFHDWLAISDQSRTYENTVEQFTGLAQQFIDQASVLRHLSLLSSDDPLVLNGKKSFFQLIFVTLAEMKNNQKIASTLINFSQSQLEKDSLSPFQRYELYQILTGIDSTLLSNELKVGLKKVMSFFSAQTLSPYQYLETAAQSQPLPKNLKILTLNTCCLPYFQSLLFSGVRPWPERITSLVDIIKKNDPDILCLQECFDRSASREFYEQLQDRYKYFFINVDPKCFGFTLKSLGLGSGLLIASKVPVTAPIYEKFAVQGPFINRGFFSFILQKEDGKTGVRIVNTHLDTNDTEQAKMVRCKQMQQIIAKIAENGSIYPTLLCGDLNIPFQSKEPAEEIIKNHFTSLYTEKIKKVTIHNRTYSDLRSFWYDPKKFVVVPEIIDYILVFNGENQQKKLSKNLCNTTLIKTHSVLNPEKALSDHQGILSAISLSD